MDIQKVNEIRRDLAAYKKRKESNENTNPSAGVFAFMFQLSPEDEDRLYANIEYLLGELGRLELLDDAAKRLLTHKRLNNVRSSRYREIERLVRRTP